MFSKVAGRSLRALMSTRITNHHTNHALISRAITSSSANHDKSIHSSITTSSQSIMDSALHQSRYLSSFTASSPQAQVQPQINTDVDPFALAKSDLSDLFEQIHSNLKATEGQLEDISKYYFDGQGKAIRPVVSCLMSKAANVHMNCSDDISDQQKTISLIAEMIHTASLLHDDVIDTADTRRGKPSVGVVWGDHKSILAGDFILSRSAKMLANIGCVKSNNYIAQILVDLVNGEFMQLENKEDFNERFTDYIEKSYKKTASLLAFSCKSVATLAGGNDQFTESAFQYGRNIGIAFQLIDDVLDFVASQSDLGKPAGADLKLGLSTGPVLFACDQYPELNELMSRRFSVEGDVEKAFDLVIKSNGLERTRQVAQAYCNAAIKAIEDWQDSPYKQALITLADRVLSRNK